MNPLLKILIDALASPYGLVVQSNDPLKLRERLYPLRKEEPEFADLSFVLSPTNPKSELWILRRVPHEKA